MKVVAAATIAAMLVNGTSIPLNVLAHEVPSAKVMTIANEGGVKQSTIQLKTNIEPTTAKTILFEHFTSKEYSDLFRVNRENITSIRNNAGNYSSAVIGNAIDGNLNTYWETNKANSGNFSNEVEVEFKEAVTINRIMYGARNSDRKGFAEEFEIYASPTSTGNTYQLVATGKHAMVAGLVEAKFTPTTFKRVKFKFKKSNQNWATLSELAFYKEDTTQDKVKNIFTDNTMSAVKPEFNTVDKISALESEAKAHPLYDSLKQHLDLAKSIVKGEVNIEGTIVVAEQRGDMVKHANQNLKFGFGNNLQPTGFAAQPGDKITVYVEANGNSLLPRLSFAQQEGSYANWRRDVALKPGKNEITVPTVPKDGAYKNKITPGGSVYIINPYTKEQQGQAPKIRFEGVDKIPFATKNTNTEEFKSFLKEYKKKLNEDIVKHPNVEDRKVLDIFEFVSDHIVWTGTATGAYKTYIEGKYSPLDTIESYNVHMKEIFRYYGLDGRDIKHDPLNIRENVRLAQPFGYMYAFTDHIGVQGDVMANHLIPFEDRGPSWGLTHEIGHKMDMNARLYGEVTNNMLPQHMSVFYGKTATRVPYEGGVYNNVMGENLKDYNAQGLFEKLGVYWQLEMYRPGYWGQLNSLYRERNVQLTNGEASKQKYLVEFSSEILKLDLSEYFARHGFTVSNETKEVTSAYKKPNEKIWYLNDSVAEYKGAGIQDKKITIDINIVPNIANKTNTLNFAMDKKYTEDFLGYEIIRDGNLVGFTSTNTFIDKNVDPTKNYLYQVVAYDKKLKSLEPVETGTFKPSLAVEEQVTLKLQQKYDPMDYVRAFNIKGEDITKDVVIKSNTVDVTKTGNYQIVYEVKNAGSLAERAINVLVTSGYTYVSDMNAKSANAVGGLTKDSSSIHTPITLIRQGYDTVYKKGLGAHANSEVVYNIDGKGFNFFESYIGIDQALKGKPSSATFEVWVDGKKQYSSGVFGKNTEHAFVKVPVKGAKEVKLVTTDANNGNAFDHTVWADAKFHFTNDDTVSYVNLEALIAEAKAVNADNYTKESMEALFASLAKAEDTLANKQTTQLEIDKVSTDLQQTLESLVKLEQNQPEIIKDNALKTSIQKTLGLTGEITLSDMDKLTTLSAPGTDTTRITSLAGLEYATNLVSLDISGNEVTDFSPLQGLSKLDNLMADPQIIEMPSVNGKDSIFVIDNVVKGLDGKKVNPFQIGLRNTSTFKEVSVDVAQLAPNADQFSIDLSENDKGTYMLVLAYKVNNNLVQIMTIINNK